MADKIIFRTVRIPALLLAMTFWFYSCSLESAKDEMLIDPDLSPPVMMEVLPPEGPELTLLFNEKVYPGEEKIVLATGEMLSLSPVGEYGIVLSPENALSAGKLYEASLSVEDASGNSCRFILPFWGWNPETPELLINEFNPEGSGNNPECIELYVRRGGNSAGCCLYYGTKEHYEYRFVLPRLTLNEGDYVIIHCRREFTAEEISESDDRSVSGGKLSSDGAWDLWLPEDKGLSGANGIISLYGHPDGLIMDAVVYSERESDPEDEHLGWTSRTFDAAADLYEQGAWTFSSDLIPPQEAVFSGYTTGTRSICRDGESKDNNEKGDWHTVPTGGKSFGEKNTEESYVPSG